MTFEEFDQLSDQLDAESKKMQDTKGKEYANKHTDRLQNFKETADRCGVTPLQACMVLMVKHQMALEGFVRNHRTFSDESVRSRVVDLITYYKLFLALVLERDESPNNWYTVGAAHKKMGLAPDVDGVSRHTTEDEKREYIRGYEEFCKQKGPEPGEYIPVQEDITPTLAQHFGLGLPTFERDISKKLKGTPKD